jgi:GDPmannose 4,6-dehydratase
VCRINSRLAGSSARAHAKDYVAMQWLMRQQDKPEVSIIAAAKELGMQICWEGEGVEEKGYWTNRHSREGGNPAQSDTPIVAEMVREDLKSAERDELIKHHGYKAMDYHE